MQSLQVNPLRKIYVAFVLLAATIVVGVTGYMIIEGYTVIESLYMTVITLATVGFTEVHQLSDAGRTFTIFLIVTGLGIFTYFITQISRYFLDGEFIRYYKTYRMQRSIDNLNGHIIICGYGRNGMEADRVLRKMGTPVVVIEHDKHTSNVFTEQVPFFILADATRDETLLQAGIERASVVITTLPDDAQNLFVCLTAKELQPSVKIISRANHLSSIKKLKSAGAHNVIMPDKIGGAHMAMLVHNPDIEEFIDIMSTSTSEDFQIQEITCGISTSLEDADCWKKFGATILGIKNKENDYRLNPSPGVRVVAGDSIIVMGSKEQLTRVKEQFN
ncbi:MAG: NAD-binding protein [Chitinophagales bacterium]